MTGKTETRTEFLRTPPPARTRAFRRQRSNERNEGFPAVVAAGLERQGVEPSNHRAARARPECRGDARLNRAWRRHWRGLAALGRKPDPGRHGLGNGLVRQCQNRSGNREEQVEPGCRRRLLTLPFLAASLLYHLAEPAGMLAVEGLLEGNCYGILLSEPHEHPRPGAQLEHSPMATRRKDEREHHEPSPQTSGHDLQRTPHPRSRVKPGLGNPGSGTCGQLVSPAKGAAICHIPLLPA